jgi:hypothetical protein
MNRKERIHSLIHQIADEVLGHIKEKEQLHTDRWVPAAEVKKQLELDFLSVPASNKQYGTRGWMFAILARILEDEGKVEYRKMGSRAYYRSK